MRRILLAAALLALLAWPSIVRAQSLADVARAEEARRKTVKQPGKVFTNEDLKRNGGGDPTSALLQSCASGADKFFLLTSATQMVSTFQKIGTALSNLRIAQ